MTVLGYVIRDTRSGIDGRVTYDIVDMAGNLFHVTVLKSLSVGDGPVDILNLAISPEAPPKPL